MTCTRGMIGWLVLAAASLTVGCSASEENQPVTFWAMGREGEMVRELITDFEQAHPEIHVDVQTVPWKGAHQKLLTAIAGNSTPDLCQLGNTWLPELAMLGALTPLDARVQASDVIERDDYFPGIWATNVVDGTLYGIPWYIDTSLLFYRKDILARAGFEQPPQTWAEWARQMAAVKQLVGPDRYAILLPTNEFEQLESFGLQQKEPMLRDGGRYGNFETPGFKHALRFYAQMFSKDWAPAVANTEIANVWTEFARGYFTFYVSGPWDIAKFKATMPDELKDAWATALLPGPDVPGVGLAGGSSLVIFKASEQKRAAWQLIEFLSRPEVQARFYEVVGDMPPRRSAWDYPALANDPHVRAFREQLESVEPVPKVPEWQQIANQLNLVGEQLAHGRLSVDEAAAELNRQADEILDKRRWVLDQKAGQ
ncbi:MAG: sugar ABC transporter substrate-binding protein [Salinisphaera sp.]|nr:sugar ABC transporter substrate-binding protein [Salinisphaera sp.]